MSIQLQSQNAKNNTTTIKVMCYNIHYGVLNDGTFNIDKAAQVIKSANADIVLLQEVDKWTKRALKQDLATELGLKTNLTPVFGKSIIYQEGFYGNAILTKFPIQKSEVTLLPYVEGTEQRSVLEILITLPNEQQIRVVSTHFDHSKNNTIRKLQSEFVNTRFKDSIPTILAGDLNATPKSDEIKVLLKEWKQVFSNNEPSFPSDTPKIKIDYMLLKPESKFKVVKTEIVKDSTTSDHRPLLSLLEIIK